MNKKAVRTVSAAVLLALVVFLCLTGAVPVLADVSTDSTVQDLEAQLRFLEEKQADLQNKMANTQSDIWDQQAYQQQLETLIATVQNKIKIATELIDTLKSHRAELEADIETAEASFDETFSEFLDYMRMTYEDGEASYLGLIFGADSLTEFLSNVDRVNSMMAYSKKLMAQYKEAKSELEKKKQECELAIGLQDSAIEALEQTKEENYMLLSNSQAYLAYLNNQQSDMKRQLEEAQAAWDKANEELTAYLEELARRSQQMYNGEGFAWPVDPSVGNLLTSRFGPRYIAAWDWYDPGHGAIDIAGYGIYGIEIHASAAGQVVFATNYGTSSYGNYIMIDHGYDSEWNDIVTLYAHCSYVSVVEGQYVNQGDVIGYVGSTGNSTGPHLHFEYRKNGVRFDPLDYVKIPDNLVDVSG